MHFFNTKMYSTGIEKLVCHYALELQHTNVQQDTSLNPKDGTKMHLILRTKYVYTRKSVDKATSGLSIFTTGMA